MDQSGTLTNTLVHVKPQSFQDCQYDCPKMIIIPAGTFNMGSVDEKSERRQNEGPQHVVRVLRFAIGETLVTRAQWAAFVKEVGNVGFQSSHLMVTSDGSEIEYCGDYQAPTNHISGDFPADCISHDEASAYVRWLSKKTGRNYRLPSEAEWEYSARAGTEARFYTGRCITTLQANFNTQGLYSDCQKGTIYRTHTTPVYYFPPNQFGLYDMAGNLYQWMADCYKSSYIGSAGDSKPFTNREECIRSNKYNVLRKNIPHSTYETITPIQETYVFRGGAWGTCCGNSSSREGLEHDVHGRYIGLRVAADI